MRTIKINTSILIAALVMTRHLLLAQANYFDPSTSGVGATANHSLVGVGQYNQNGPTTGSYNTSVGYSAMNTQTSGNHNSAFGYYALQNNTTASYNTALGYTTLFINTGANNTAAGWFGLLSNGSGSNSTSLGSGSLLSNTTGSDNVGLGSNCNGTISTNGTSTGVGANALFYNTAADNTGIGYQALYTNASSDKNTAFGYNASYTNTGASNGSFGYQAHTAVTTGYENFAFGYQSISAATTGSFWEAAIGYGTLNKVATGGNTAIGTNALHAYDHGNGVEFGNTAFGYAALSQMTSCNGLGSSSFGYSSGQTQLTYQGCTFFGAFADASTTGLYDASAIGYGASVTANHNIIFGSSTVTAIGSPSGTVGWNILSDGRFKKDIQKNVPGLSFITALRPVTYHLDVPKLDKYLYGEKSAEIENTLENLNHSVSSKGQITYTGFIAQEVEETAGKIGYDFSGVSKPQNEHDFYGITYTDFVAPLTKAIQEQQTMIKSRRAQLEAQAKAIEDATTEINALESELDVVSEKVEIVKGCCHEENSLGGQASQLLKAVPNPTSGLSTIYLFLPESAQVGVIQIINGNGVLMKEYETKTSGYTSINVETSNLTIGTYYYSLIVNGKVVDTKKLQVIH